MGGVVVFNEQKEKRKEKKRRSAVTPAASAYNFCLTAPSNMAPPIRYNNVLILYHDVSRPWFTGTYAIGLFSYIDFWFPPD